MPPRQLGVGWGPSARKCEVIGRQGEGPTSAAHEMAVNSKNDERGEQGDQEEDGKDEVIARAEESEHA